MAKISSFVCRVAWPASTMVVFFLGLSARPSFAHKVDVFTHTEGHMIHGQVRFAGDIPAKDATVTVRNSAGKTLGTVITDEHGQFLFEAKTRCDHYFTVDAGGGHGAEHLVKAAELPDDLAAPPSAKHGGNADEAPVDLASLERQVIALREQLHAYEQATRLRDVLGGIGYIVGLMGVTFYFLGTRRIFTKSPGKAGG